MSDMVERIARAMCAVTARDPDDLSGGPHPLGLWLDAGEPWWKGYEEAASAAIADMREPTGAMIEAAREAEREYGGTSGAPPSIHWEAMIDAALAEPHP